MRKKRFLAAILLGVVFCFVVSGVGYGEVQEWLFEEKASLIHVTLLSARIDYIMQNPTSYLRVQFGHNAERQENLKQIFVMVHDNRDIFSYKSGVALLDTFKRELEIIYSFIAHIASDMNTDVMATFHSRGGIQLGSFFNGKYHLSEE